MQYKEGRTYTGGVPSPGGVTFESPGPINTYTEEVGHGAVIAIDPHTGEKKWSFEMHDVTIAAFSRPASDLLFAGGREGYFQALNAKSGALLWKVISGDP